MLSSQYKSSRRLLPDFNLAEPVSGPKPKLANEMLSYREKSCIRFVLPQLDINLEANNKGKVATSAKLALAVSIRRHQIMISMIYYLKLVKKLGKTLKQVAFADTDAKREIFKQRSILQEHVLLFL